MHPPDITLTELVDQADASIRLRHIIHAISESPLKGFGSVHEYLNNRVENEANLRRWRGIGQKSIDEFNLILQRYTSDNQAFVDKRKLVLASSGLTPIQLKNPNLLLTELVENANSSIRLKHAIQGICGSENPPFTTVGEYISDRIRNEAKLKSQQNVGKTTVQEFNDLINLFLASEEECIEKWDGDKKRDVKGLDFYRSAIAKLISDCEEINKRYPGTFENLSITVNSLSIEDNDLHEKLTQLSKVVSGILKDPKRAKMMEMRVCGASLEEAAKESGVTRERVRQIEQPLKEGVLNFV